SRRRSATSIILIFLQINNGSTTIKRMIAGIVRSIKEPCKPYKKAKRLTPLRLVHQFTKDG
ncbi:hypothetical protein, partial [Aeromonas veronii]|uniref:hypothetical protein n=1 Tax=Aeromonas veronii TaxID=654 RepID=UPI003D1D52A2